ncbi:hypothetical protein [Sulfurisphaera javensis]
MIELLIKHRYGDNGLLAYIDLSFALATGLVISYNSLYPLTRIVDSTQQLATFNIILWVESLILTTLNIKNISLGLGQDLFDGTIISFLQMRGRKKFFLASYFIDVLLLGILYILATEVVFYLSSFTPPSLWFIEFFSLYLFISNISLLITIILKRPYRSFFISIILVFGFLFLLLKGMFSVSQYILVLSFIIVYVDYLLFRRVTI